MRKTQVLSGLDDLLHLALVCQVDVFCIRNGNHFKRSCDSFGLAAFPDRNSHRLLLLSYATVIVTVVTSVSVLVTIVRLAPDASVRTSVIVSVSNVKTSVRTAVFPDECTMR